MQETVSTPRLLLNSLNLLDAAFIRALYNSPGWLKYIGDRDIHNIEAAESYIEKTLANPEVRFWAVRLREGEVAIGIITLVKRDSLPYPDIGYALLPEYQGIGFAFEAASAVMDVLLAIPAPPYILANTLPENAKSIRLLEKLGMSLMEELKIGEELLWVFGRKKNDFPVAQK